MHEGDIKAMFITQFITEKYGVEIIKAKEIDIFHFLVLKSACMFLLLLLYYSDDKQRERETYLL